MGRQANTFKKQERLSGKKVITELFKHGKTGLNYPLKFIFIENEPVENGHASVAIAVSKRNFRKAVDRNLIKRRIREAYRLNKQILYSGSTGKKVSVMLIYVADEVLSFSLIDKSMKQVLIRIAKGIKAPSNI